MRIDAIDMNMEMMDNLSYLEASGLSSRFTQNTLDDNSGGRYKSENGSLAAQTMNIGYWYQQVMAAKQSQSGSDDPMEAVTGVSRKKGKRSVRSMDINDIIKSMDISKNKFLILMLMRRSNLVELLNFLTKDQLVNAMYLFPKSMLVRFIRNLPKEIILKLLLTVIPLEKFIQMFSTKALMSMMSSKRLDVKSIVAGLEQLPEELRKLMTTITGQPSDKIKKKELLAMFQQMDKEQILEGLKSMQMKFFYELCTNVIRKDPELMMNLPRGEIVDIVGRIPKPVLGGMFNHLPEDMLIQYLSVLPDRELTIAVSQIDDTMFASLLANKFQDFLLTIAESQAA